MTLKHILFVCQGDSTSPHELSESGRQSAARAANKVDHFLGVTSERFVCAPHGCAMETASIIARRRLATYHVAPDLRIQERLRDTAKQIIKDARINGAAVLVLVGDAGIILPLLPHAHNNAPYVIAQGDIVALDLNAKTLVWL